MSKLHLYRKHINNFKNKKKIIYEKSKKLVLDNVETNDFSLDSFIHSLDLIKQEECYDDRVEIIETLLYGDLRQCIFSITTNNNLILRINRCWYRESNLEIVRFESLKVDEFNKNIRNICHNDVDYSEGENIKIPIFDDIAGVNNKTFLYSSDDIGKDNYDEMFKNIKEVIKIHRTCVKSLVKFDMLNIEKIIDIFDTERIKLLNQIISFIEKSNSIIDTPNSIIDKIIDTPNSFIDKIIELGEKEKELNRKIDEKIASSICYKKELEFSLSESFDNGKILRSQGELTESITIKELNYYPYNLIKMKNK